VARHFAPLTVGMLFIISVLLCVGDAYGRTGRSETPRPIFFSAVHAVR
jgi:hypothetical protein